MARRSPTANRPIESLEISARWLTDSIWGNRPFSHPVGTSGSLVAGGANCSYHLRTMRSALFCLIVTLSAPTWAQIPPLSKEVDTVYPEAHSLSLDWHKNPKQTERPSGRKKL